MILNNLKLITKSDERIDKSRTAEILKNRKLGKNTRS